jgi:hypothetical protein
MVESPEGLALQGGLCYAAKNKYAGITNKKPYAVSYPFLYLTSKIDIPNSIE